MPARDAVWSVSAGTVVPSGAISSRGAVAEATLGELLALGSHGLGATSSLLLGSTSARTRRLPGHPRTSRRSGARVTGRRRRRRGPAVVSHRARPPPAARRHRTSAGCGRTRRRTRRGRSRGAGPGRVTPSARAVRRGLCRDRARSSRPGRGGPGQPGPPPPKVPPWAVTPPPQTGVRVILHQLHSTSGAGAGAERHILGPDRPWQDPSLGVAHHGRPAGTPAEPMRTLSGRGRSAPERAFGSLSGPAPGVHARW